MPLSDFLRDKWEQLLSNWADCYFGVGGASAGVSGVYDADNWRKGTARATTAIVLLGPARDTDTLLTKVRATHPALYDALEEWARNRGERHAQAARLTISPNTYRDRVDSGMRLLEDFSMQRKAVEIKNRRIANEASIARSARPYDTDACDD